MKSIIRPHAIKMHIEIAIVAILISSLILLGSSLLGGIALWAVVAVWGIALLAGLVAMIKEHSKSIEIGEDSLIIKTGILSTKTTVIPYWTITDVDIEQNIVDKILGLGTLSVDTAGTSNVEVVMKNLSYADLKELIEVFKKKMKGGQYERAQ
jgi:putative membrane protein